MTAIPDISTSSERIVVEDLRVRRPLLGLFGQTEWRVRWRRADDPVTQGVSVLRPGQTVGKAELAGESFGFAIRWRRDLRRPIGSRRSEPRHEQGIASPASAL